MEDDVASISGFPFLMTLKLPGTILRGLFLTVSCLIQVWGGHSHSHGTVCTDFGHLCSGNSFQTKHASLPLHKTVCRRLADIKEKINEPPDTSDERQLPPSSYRKLWGKTSWKRLTTGDHMLYQPVWWPHSPKSAMLGYKGQRCGKLLVMSSGNTRGQ